VVADLRFDTEPQYALLIQVRTFQNCRIEQQGSQHSVFDTESEEVGVLWFDVKTDPHFQHCVVIGMEVDRKEHPHKTYYILATRELSSKNMYERVGVGKIKARYVSREAREGKLL
jgi:hypothetical protein